MAYKFFLNNTTSRQLLTLSASGLNNQYIDYTAKGSPSSSTVKDENAWSTNLNPRNIVNGYSAPIKLFHSHTSRFLGSTKQEQPISSGGGATGMVAGSVIYTCPDNALEFVFKVVSPDNYQIILYESRIIEENTKCLCFDRNNGTQVMITNYKVATPSAVLDNIWQYSSN